MLPPASLTAPLGKAAVAWKPWHMMLASSLWPQLCVPRGLCRQSSNLFSLPVQWILSRKILTVLLALLKAARDSAIAATKLIFQRVNRPGDYNCIKNILPATRPVYTHYIPELGNPNCEHTTVASGDPHESSHTVPHSSPLHTSTRPSLEVLPSLNLTSPSTQP